MAFTCQIFLMASHLLITLFRGGSVATEAKNADHILVKDFRDGKGGMLKVPKLHVFNKKLAEKFVSSGD
jgi:hypothetical protein